jgi:putative transposase
VAFAVDTFSRRIVGWAASTNKRTQFVLDALDMGLWQRDRTGTPVRPDELIHHSDAGSQYTSFRLAAHLAAEDIAASIGSVGDAYDNALMESTLRTLADVEIATAEWVDWYNHTRLHGELSHVPPVEYEAAYYLQNTQNQQVTTTI